MTNRIEGEFCATIKGVNLTAASNIQFYVLQANHFFEYKPEVIAPNMVYFQIPYEDAMQIHAGIPCKMQCAWTDEFGKPRKTKILLVLPDEFLKKEGYK